MTLNDMLAMVWFVSTIGAGVFSLSGLINLLRKHPTKADWKKALFFFILSAITLFSFDVTLEEDNIIQEDNQMQMHQHNR